MTGLRESRDLASSAADIDFAELFDQLPASLMMLDRDLRFVACNQAYLSVTGANAEDLIGRYVFDVFPEKPEREAHFKAQFARTLAGEETRTEGKLFRIVDADGKPRDVYWTTIQRPYRNQSGEIVGMLQMAQDVTGEILAERRNAIISRELDHRVKNLLSIVASIGRRTAKHSITIADFLDRFDARLGAMAVTHEQLASNKWDGMTLKALVSSALKSFINAEADVEIEGPRVMLSAKQVQTLSLAIHELATNASKYGALRDERGKLSVRWSWQDETDPPALRFDWTETVASPIEAAGTKGFGSEIMDVVVPSQLGGHAERTLTKTGLHYSLVFHPSQTGDEI
ncbi:HWE histidine kinase domain-containing protein [Parasphingopyxis sp.]|uniref:sensor histidine kinase n=1 Tax=Parasphingopyxis sp. TaxID=1920299 RepID=UPI002613148B|nr:HWE histidine kinase domain-containing protein [Parasphingopyxis sp.]